MKKKFTKILGVGLTLALLCSLVLTAAPVSADVSEPDVILGDEEISAESTYTITFNVNEELVAAATDATDESTADGSATLSDVQHRSGTESWLMSSGTDDGSNAGRITILVPDIPIADFGGATFWLYEPTGTTVGGAIPNTDQIYPYGTPYINILLDTDDDGTWDEKLEGIGSIPVGSTRSPTTHPAPTVDTWVQMEEGYGYYDMDDGLSQGTWKGPEVGGGGHPWQIGTLAEWQTYIATVTAYDDCQVVGVEITFGFWGVSQTGDVYVDDIGGLGIGSITVEFPEGTVVADTWDNADVTVQSTSGFGEKNEATDVGDDVVTTVEDDVYTVTIGLGQLTYNVAETATVRVKFLDDQITNPDEPGDYTLWVSTSEETDLVESEAYTIEVPDVGVLPGVVELYNPNGILMDSDTGSGAIQRMLKKADEGWTLKIGEGLYTTDPDTVEADVTIEGSGDVEDIIVEGTWTIDEEDITIDNLTLDGDGGRNALVVTANDFTIQNCILEDADAVLIRDDGSETDHPTTIEDCTFNIEDEIGVVANADAAVITDSTFNVEEDGTGVGIVINADIEVTDCIFNGGSGVGVEVNAGDSAISGSTFDSLDTALDINAGTVTATGNTIENCAAEAIIVTTATSVTLSGNTITGNDADDILQVAADAEKVYMLFNTIIDNDGADGLLIDNNNTDVPLIVANNWWGDAAGPGDDAFSDDVVSEPFLAGPISTTAGIAADVKAGTTADFEDDVGVTVVADTGIMAVVAASQYLVNPVAAIDDAVGFWDIYVAEGAVALDDIAIRIYTDVTGDTEVWVWGEAKGEWLKATTYTTNLFSGFILVEVDDTTGIPMIDDLGALPFAVIEPAAATEIDESPEILAPLTGDDTVSLTPIFAWGAVDGADGYYFEFADNANFVSPMVKLDGDLGRLVVTAYAYVGELPYSEPYYWRVKAVSGTIAAGDLAESAWSTGVFITMEEPEEELPPVVVEEAPPVIIEPIVEVITPAATEITPAWIYVIIGVGGVLVIALLVLIVRTRRVA